MKLASSGGGSRTNAVCSADGAPRLTAYPAMTREWSSSITVSHGRAGLPDGVTTHRSSWV
jgi:hypothetical protein